MTDLSVLMTKRYILKSYIDSDYQGLIAIIKDFNYRTGIDGKMEETSLQVLVEYENGITEWRKFSNFEEYIEPEVREQQINEKFKSLDKNILYELKLSMLAGLVLSGIPEDYLSEGKELEDLKNKIKELSNKMSNQH